MSESTRVRTINATRIAAKIVKKFPQIEQHVIAPALTMEIAMALIKAASNGNAEPRQEEQR
jgi:hypothetical protein